MGKCEGAGAGGNSAEGSGSPRGADVASPRGTAEFSWTVPPEAPVFRPTPQEFRDPLAYISKIRPLAEKCGICKIKPPEEWQPPFAVDVDKLRFTPRIQRLNELEAITRVKLNFLDQMIKFWELQGSILKIPIVEKKPLDLYSLHKIVRDAGGFDVCTAERKWSKIASRLGFPQGKGVGSILKNHYERILYPYDVFKEGGATDIKLEAKDDQTPEKAGGAATRARSATKLSPAAAAVTPPPDVKPSRRWNKLNNEQETEHEGSQTEGALAGAEDTKNKRLATPVKEDGETRRSSLRESPAKRWSAGGLTESCGSRATRSSRALREHRRSNMTVSVTPAPDPAAVPAEPDPLAKYMCHNCGRGDVEEQMLLCDGCDDSYHTFCLVPPLADVPKGDWRCPVCIAQEVSKPTEAFGFEQARREYTLQQFGEMADQFKSAYFNMPVHMVPIPTVEKEFWRIVSSIDEDVTVEYGADLHSMDHGSGFPTKSTAALFPGEHEYAESPWNLNNMPVLEGSVLGHINADISGMKIPWMYVGMCFATFCWHNEDHWSYSINYLHWGEPKTWYGVPGSKAEQFEETMKSAAPELFDWQPDLLHQLVTIMNPNILMTAGVPVYRCDQNAGEFVITFPRAYHAGFNQGYNFAEAVNFTPADWLKMGRECIAHYSTLRRYCVFSHDEVVCSMANSVDTLGLTVGLAVHQDVRQMLSDERKLRKSLLEWGVTKAERSIMESLPDDARQCQFCNTTCFLSAVSCGCTRHLVCLKHYTSLCNCAPEAHKLMYRYTLDELAAMLEALKRKSEAFREWADAVQQALAPDSPKTCDLDGLRAYCRRAQELKLQKTELMRALETAIEDAEKCASVIQQLDLNKMRTRTRHRDTVHEPKYRLSVEELTLFCVEIDGLACVLPEGSAVKEVLRQTVEFERRSEELLSSELGEGGASELRELDAVVELGSQLCIQLPKLPLIQARQQQAKLLHEIKTYREDCEQLTPEVMVRLVEAGTKAPPHTKIETEMAYLAQLKIQVEDWEKRAKAVLIAKQPDGTEPESNSVPHTSLAELEALLAEGDDLEAALPSQHTLASAVNHAKDWLAKVEEMQSKESYPYYHTLESIVKRGVAIPLSLYEKDQLTQALESAREWKQKAASTFLGRSCPFSLMEALSPRTDLLSQFPRRPRARHAPGSDPPPSCLEAELFLRNFSEESSPTEIVAAFKQAEEREMNNMRELRSRNSSKNVRAQPQPGVTFCMCQKRQYGLMTQCELCKDWFHAACVVKDESPDSSPSREATPPPSLPFPQRERKFLCPNCTRTKRPRLERILGLLVWLQRLPVRLAEGEALQCVTERAMAWQDAARSALAAPHLAAALSDCHQGKDKAERLNAELKRAAGKGGDSSRLSATSEHAYSASPRSPPSQRLPSHMLHKLEELMMEGDLLEVALDETAHVWNVVCTARGPGSNTAQAPARGPGASTAHAPVRPRSAAADPARLKRRPQSRGRPHHQMKRSRQFRETSPQRHGHLKSLGGVSKGATSKRGSSAGGNLPTTTNYLNRKQSLSSGGGLMMRKHYMARQERRKHGMQPVKVKSQRGRGRGRGGGGAARAREMRPADGDSTSETSSNDDDEDCAANMCLRPTGKEVDWVQCDGGCEGWFHMHCVGLAKNSLKEDEDYFCRACRPADAFGASPGQP